MRFHPATRTLAFGLVAAGVGSAIWFTGAKQSIGSAVPQVPAEQSASAPAGVSEAARAGTARAIILSPHEGAEPIDEEIRRAQARIAATPHAEVSVERLGRLFIAKARLSNDPGFYMLAEKCGHLLETMQPGLPSAMLLRGHALAAMHRFREAEAIAQQLVSCRENALDFALLGDARMEQGRLDDAVAAYQQTADLKPSLQAYTRIAHLRWLTGDLDGAIEMMTLAIESGSARDAEPLAWATTRLAAYELQRGEFGAAHRLNGRALELVPDFAPALLLHGRLLLAEGRSAEAVEPLQRAALRNPFPETQWALADALREVGENAQAAAVERQIEARGASSDPRTFSLYLATRRVHPDHALQFAERELAERRDVFTYDALAWAQWAAGRTADALSSAEQALREETQDARLFLHAGVIAAHAGRSDLARDRLRQAAALRRMLLPSECQLLDAELAALEAGAAPAIAPSLTSTQTHKPDVQTPK